MSTGQLAWLGRFSRCFMRSLSILAGLMATTAVSTSALHAGDVWEQATEPEFRLGVRDRYNERPKVYVATFIVHSPDGRNHSANKQITGDDMGCVVFPKDFDTAVFASPGLY